MTAPLVFMETETTGLGLSDHIWEFGGIRREPDGSEETLHLFIEHNEQRCRQLPEPFLTDHLARFPGHGQETKKGTAAVKIAEFLDPAAGGERAHVVGAVPNFDTERIALLLNEFGNLPAWHHHLIDVEALAVGYLEGRRSMSKDGVPRLSLPWDSDELSRACGVKPPGEGERHTALGDARWAMRLDGAITWGLQ